jgi:hypothetical protein
MELFGHICDGKTKSGFGLGFTVINNESKPPQPLPAVKL